MTTWPCKSMPTALWFPDMWEDTPFHEGLENARELCDQCPERVSCLALAMKTEADDGVDYRSGIYAGTTPQQRFAMFKRGQALACSVCEADYDPVELRNGTPRCLCGNHDKVPTIPDRGDQWTERHTKLARMTIGWMIDNVEEGGEVPDALSLSRKMRVGVKDLRRVYQALREDHVLRRTETGALVVRKLAAAVDHWLPKHLRQTRSMRAAAREMAGQTASSVTVPQ